MKMKCCWGLPLPIKKTIARVILRWNVQRGVTVIPKSTRQERIAENFDLWDFSPNR